MNMYVNSKKGKKFILVLVILLLFNFCFPKQVKAIDFDLAGGFSSLLFWMERGIFRLVNDLFCDDNNDYVYHIEGSTIHIDKDDNKTETQKVNIRLRLTPENIIKGKFLLFNADIFENVTDASKYYDAGPGKNTISGREGLRNVIAGWYYALRNFSIVALLSVLVYVGIRMIMSTIAQDKAKYKSMFKDWLVALCLLIAMHYMMITILSLTTKVVDAIGTSGGANSQTEEIFIKIANINEGDEEDVDGIEDVRWQETKNGVTKYYTIGDAFGYEFLLLAVLIFTIIFAFKYLKREFTIIFLILLGPISCITYPIDKISDGKAQAFNKWFSEFLYNVIIQPFHLLIYIVLVGSATELANDNILYSIVCFAVMIPAEKFVKEMFGFRDKLGSPLGAFAGGAIAGNLLSRMRGGGPSKSNKNDDTSNESTDLPVKTKSTSDLIGKGDGSGDDGTGGAGANGNTDENSGIDTRDRAELEAGTDENAESDISANDNQLDASENAESDDGANDNQLDAGENDESDAGANDQSDAGANDQSDAGENAESDVGANNENAGQGEDTNPNEDAKNGDKEQGRMARGFSAIRDRHNRKLYRKYGTASGKELWKKRGGAVLKASGGFVGRTVGKTIRGATTLAGAAALGTLGLMTGNGKEFAMAGAALGRGAGNLVTKNRIVSATGEYAKEFNKGAFKKDTNKQKFMTNAANIDRARRNFKVRNGGRLGSAKDINQDLEAMYKMRQFGVNDALIDDAMDQYHKNQNQGKMSDEDALNSSILSATMLQDYTKDKLRDPKAMERVYNDYFARFKAAGNSDAEADEKVRKLMKDGAELRGVQNIALPPTSSTVDLTVPSNQQMVTALGIQGGIDSGDIRAEQVNELTLRLHKEGYTGKEIIQIAKSTSDSKVKSVEVLDRFKAKVEFLEDKNAQEQATKFIASPTGSSTNETPKVVTKQQVKTEMKKRLEILSVGADPKELDSIRASDDMIYGHQSLSEKQMALNIARKNSTRQMNNSPEMTKGIKELAKELKKNGTVSDDGIKKATEIYERAANLKGTTLASDFTTKPNIN